MKQKNLWAYSDMIYRIISAINENGRKDLGINILQTSVKSYIQAMSFGKNYQ